MTVDTESWVVIVVTLLNVGMWFLTAALLGQRDEARAERDRWKAAAETQTAIRRFARDRQIMRRACAACGGPITRPVGRWCSETCARDEDGH